MRPFPAPRRRPLVVVSPRVRDLADIAQTGQPLITSTGDDIPDAPDGAAWWMPPAVATRLWASGINPPLTAPGPHWLPTIAHTHPHLTGRAVHALPAAHLNRLPGPGWVQPAQAAIDHFPTGWLTPTAAHRAAVEAAVAPDTWMHWSPTPLDTLTEVRVHVLHGMTVTASIHRHDARTSGAALHSPAVLSDAVTFAQHAVDALRGHHPAGWVLTVARTLHRQWVILDGHPAWATAWHDADPWRVRACIDAACPDTGVHVGAREHHDWGWTPDPTEQRRTHQTPRAG